jgi:hypothetical protein
VFKNLSIRWKLLAVIMTITSTALVLVAVFASIYDRAAYKENLLRNLEALGGMVVDTAMAAHFEDPIAAAEALSHLHHEPRIEAACLYYADETVLSYYHRDGTDFTPSPLDRDRVGYQGARLIMVRPVAQEGEVLGYLYLQRDLIDVEDRLFEFARLAGGLLVGALVLSFLMATRLQKVVAEPVENLAEVVRQVAGTKDYSVRAPDLQAKTGSGSRCVCRIPAPASPRRYSRMCSYLFLLPRK